MKVINRMGVVIESMATLRVMIPACVISLTVGYLSFGSMGGCLWRRRCLAW